MNDTHDTNDTNDTNGMNDMNGVNDLTCHDMTAIDWQAWNCATDMVIFGSKL